MLTLPNKRPLESKIAMKRRACVFAKRTIQEAFSSTIDEKAS
jgi:hypothetical protein